MTFLNHLVFRPIGGIWQDADGRVLADVLTQYGLTIDERTQFARIYDYERCECYYYRAFGACKITLDIYPIDVR